MHVVRASVLAACLGAATLLGAAHPGTTAETAAKARFTITDYGAATSAALNTAAIQKTIDAAASAGGGIVEIPAGTFRSGSIFLKPGVHLHLAKGAVLQGSTDIADYPKRDTRIEGHTEPWRMALVNASGTDGLRITGEGTLDGNGAPFWAAFWQRRKEKPDCTNLEVERPRLVFIEDSRDVRLEGITLLDAGFWNIHLYRCRDVVVDGLTITTPREGTARAPSTDGIDVDSCQKVVIRNCRISVDDDCIALKGSKGPLADKDASSPPVEDIVVENCTFPRGHGLVTFGSEATVVRRVTVRKCQAGAAGNVVRLKLRPDTPQLYEDILFEDIELDAPTGSLIQARPWTQFFDLQGHPPKPSVVRNLTVRRVRGSFGSLGVLRGNPGDTIRDVVLEDVHLDVRREGLDVGEVTGLQVRDVVVNGKPFALGAQP